MASTLDHISNYYHKQSTQGSLHKMMIGRGMIDTMKRMGVQGNTHSHVQNVSAGKFFSRLDYIQWLPKVSRCFYERGNLTIYMLCITHIATILSNYLHIHGTYYYYIFCTNSNQVSFDHQSILENPKFHILPPKGEMPAALDLCL